MDYINNILSSMGILKVEEKPKFAKPTGYKNVNTSQMGK